MIIQRGKKQTGFTIIELLIVIVIIGILAALVIVGYSGLQQRARNADRNSDVNAIKKAVELYYADTGQYPQQGTVVGMDTEFPITTLHLPRGAILSPLAPTGATNSITENGTTYGAAPTQYYLYQALQADGNVCWASNHICTGWRLSYRLEGDSANSSVKGGTYP